MFPAARITDMHLCPMVTPGLPPVPHVGGPITGPGCSTVLIGYMPAARVTDMATCVGPPDIITKGSTTVLIGYMPAARMLDQTAHGGMIVLGCPTVLIGDTGGGGGGGGAGAGGGGGGGAAAGPPPQVVAAYQSGIGANIAPVSPEQAGPLQPKEEEDKEKKKTWIGIRLKDFKGQPMPNQDFQITLNSGQVLKGRTNARGYARFENLDPDSGNVAFTELTDIKDEEKAQEAPSQKLAGAQVMDYDSKPLPKPETKESFPENIPDQAFDEGLFYEEDED